MNNIDIIDNSNTQTQKTQSNITAKMAIDMLQKGNERFLTNKRLVRVYEQQVAETANGQYPFAAILSCIDSRVPTEIVFDQGIGDVFNASIAGNIVNDDILGSMEFACKIAGVKLIVVLGHTSCGAVKGACDSAQLGKLTQLLDKLAPAIEETSTFPEEDRNSGNIDFVNRVALKNAQMTVDNILLRSSVLSDLKNQGSLDVVAAMYDVSSGRVEFLDN